MSELNFTLEEFRKMAERAYPKSFYYRNGWPQGIDLMVEAIEAKGHTFKPKMNEPDVGEVFRSSHIVRTGMIVYRTDDYSGIPLVAVASSNGDWSESGLVGYHRRERYHGWIIARVPREDF